MTQTRSGTVVVGVDGSRASVAALILALREAHEQHQAVEVVTVWAPPAPAGGGDGGLFMARAARRRALRVQTLATTRAVRLAGCHVPITGVLLDGDPADILVQASGDAARLVLGSSRSRGVRRRPGGVRGAALPDRGDLPRAGGAGGHLRGAARRSAPPRDIWSHTWPRLPRRTDPCWYVR